MDLSHQLHAHACSGSMHLLWRGATLCSLLGQCAAAFQVLGLHRPALATGLHDVMPHAVL
jgi:hypothetical protein